MKVIQLLPYLARLILVQRTKHLHHHQHGLMKLVEHLLLHQMELFENRQHDCFHRSRVLGVPLVHGQALTHGQGDSRLPHPYKRSPRRGLWWRYRPPILIMDLERKRSNL
jgi:hypothetical protein